MRAHRFHRSSMIDRIAYDDDTDVLWIWFRDTGKYAYYAVPPTLFEAFCKASSAGTFFNEHIKGHFRCQRDPARRGFGPNA